MANTEGTQMQARLILTLVLLTTAVGVSAAETITPGLYKSTVKTEMTMGAMQMPARTMSSEQCITAEEVAAGPPLAKPEGGDCEMVKYEFGDGRITMEMACRMQGGEGRMVGTGQYTKDSFDMVNNMTVKAEGVEMNMRSAVSAKRISDC